MCQFVTFTDNFYSFSGLARNVTDAVCRILEEEEKRKKKAVSTGSTGENN